MSGYGGRFSTVDIAKIRDVLLAACQSDSEFAKEVRSKGFHYEFPKYGKEPTSMAVRVALE